MLLLAKAIHKSYVRRRRAEGAAEDDPSLAPWKSLPETLRKSNLDQAEDIERKLAAIRCKLLPAGANGPVLFAFTNAELERLAELEHERWLEERRRDGWTLAPVKDVRLKQSPYMVPWGELDEPARDLDREVVRSLPRLLADAGFTIQRIGDKES